MIEILYSPKNNKIFLFEGKFKFDVKTKSVIIYLTGKGSKCIKVGELEHIGWL